MTPKQLQENLDKLRVNATSDYNKTMVNVALTMSYCLLEANEKGHLDLNEFPNLQSLIQLVNLMEVLCDGQDIDYYKRNSPY